MKKYYIIVLMLFVIEVTASTNENWIVAFTNNQWAVSVTLTTSNLVLRTPADYASFVAAFDRWDYGINSYTYIPKLNEDFVITTNRVTELFRGHSHARYNFTPVSFTNNLTGFKIVYARIEGMQLYVSLGKYFEDTYYIALSDTPVEVGEADVENPNIAKMEDEED